MRKSTRFCAAAALAGAIVLGAPGAAAPAATRAEAMFRVDASHSGLFPAAAGPALEGVRWSFHTHGPVRGSPTVADGMVLVGSGDGNLYALDVATGRERWHAGLGGAVASGPAVAGGLVFATSRERRVTALELETGRVRWQFEAGADRAFAWSWDFWLSSPSVSGDRVFVGSGDGSVYALKASSGQRLWQYETGGRVRSSPAVSDGVVYVGGMDGKLYALDAATGKSRWIFETEGVSIDSRKAGFDRTSIVSSPSVSGDLVFVGSRDAQLYAVERATGKERWRFGHKIDYLDGNPEVSWVLGSPALADGLVFTGSSDGRFFNAVRASTGEEVWRFKTPKNVLSSAALASGQVFFGCEDGHLFALDAKTGVERWRFRTAGAVISSPAVGAGAVYVGSDDGVVYAIATGPERPGARTRRAVFWKDSGGHKWFKGDVNVRDYFQSEGYALLDEAGLVQFLSDSSGASRSVVVVAGDQLPAEAVAGSPDASLLRRFLGAGGRVVWLGLPPDCFERDPKTGQAIRFDPGRTTRLLGVRHELGSFDWMGATATPEGRRWGVTEWYLGGFAVPPADVTTVLALDEFGLASGWVKSYGGPAGSGFVRVWGREESIPDLSWVQAVAEHAE
ncbi:MAG TPA: PQQ-binding-like beta-propeller repeat protein [Thermoanaerobaculia bacterium]|nr:PQQ-binding-like beta-propeller repeat protein [Thermoanaerobaculia bacterium]